MRLERTGQMRWQAWDVRSKWKEVPTMLIAVKLMAQCSQHSYCIG
jgi:hypothetical protein